MSELTPCNYCTLKKMKANYKGQRLHKVRETKLGTTWISIYFVPKGEKLDTRRDPKTWNHLSDQWKSSMLEISDHCVC